MKSWVRTYAHATRQYDGWLWRKWDADKRWCVCALDGVTERRSYLSTHRILWYSFQFNLRFNTDESKLTVRTIWTDNDHHHHHSPSFTIHIDVLFVLANEPTICNQTDDDFDDDALNWWFYRRQWNCSYRVCDPSQFKLLRASCASQYYSMDFDLFRMRSKNLLFAMPQCLLCVLFAISPNFRFDFR